MCIFAHARCGLGMRLSKRLLEHTPIRKKEHYCCHCNIEKIISMFCKAPFLVLDGIRKLGGSIDFPLILQYDGISQYWYSFSIMTLSSIYGCTQIYQCTENFTTRTIRSQMVQFSARIISSLLYLVYVMNLHAQFSHQCWIASQM